MKLKINITKDVLQRSMLCGTTPELECLSSNCAIAVAIRDLFPEASVGLFKIAFDDNYDFTMLAHLPEEAQVFIRKFDSLKSTPEERLNLPEMSFEIDVPQEVIDSIGIDEVHTILKDHKSMELV